MMRLHQLTLIFTIIFGTMVVLNLWKTEIREIDCRRQMQLEKACNSGISSAAEKLAEELNYHKTGSASENIRDTFYEAVIAALGAYYSNDTVNTVETVVPIFVIAREKTYEIYRPTVNAQGKYLYVSTGENVYGSDINGEYVICGYGREKCIYTLEQEIKNATESTLRLKGREKNITVDFPEYAFSEYVETINSPAVLAVSVLKNTIGADYSLNIYGAAIVTHTAYISFNNNGIKEMHKENCETIKALSETVRSGLEKYETAEDAAAAGNYPAACCDPIGYYLVRSLSDPDFY